jgi:hypothetical protein
MENVEFYILLNMTHGGTRYRSWSRHYATSRKVVSSIPEEVIGFFNLRNTFSLTMCLGSTQPLNRNDYQESSWGGGSVAGA